MRLLDGTVRSRSLGGFLDLVLRVLTSVVLFFGGQNATSSAGFFPSLVQYGYFHENVKQKPLSHTKTIELIQY